MPDSDRARWEAELRALREEIAELRAEQHQIAKAVLEMSVAFRQVAVHLGIASEPYAPKRKQENDPRELPGFG